MLPVIGAGIAGALRVGAGWVARSAIPLAGAGIRRGLGFAGVWGGRIVAGLALTGLLPKVAGVGVKVASFAATYAAVRAVLYEFVGPIFDEIQLIYPSSLDPLRYVFQGMYATRELFPWGDVFVAAGIFLELMLIITSWRLTMWAYSLASKVLGEIGDA